MNKIAGIERLWALTSGGPEVSVAVLDGSVELTHPALQGADLRQFGSDCAMKTAGVTSGHGTHVTSVIFGQRGEPVRGIAPRCRGILVTIFGADAQGQGPRCSQIELARAINLAGTEGADIINISGGEFSSSGSAHPILADVINTWAERGILIVAAAGNQGCECLHVPGALPAVLAVGAMNAQGEPLDFSNWGASYQDNGVLAPGENIRGAEPGGGVAERSGTSYATPIVSGVAALLLHLARKRGIPITPHGVRDLIVASALGCEYKKLADCRRVLAGRLNVDGAIKHLLDREIAVMTNSSSLPNVTPSDACADTPVIGPATDSVPHCALEAPSIEPALLHPQESENVMTSTMPTSESSSAASGSQVTPADCGCGGKKQPPQLVFALGKLSFDYGTRQRRDFFINDMKKALGLPAPPIDDAATLLAYLGKDESKRQFLTSIIWTLKLDESTIYAIKPFDAYASEIYDTFVGILLSQLKNGTSIEGFKSKGESVERISVPGVITGQVRLFTGETVPVIAPDIRGIYSWTLNALKNLLATELKPKKDKGDSPSQGPGPDIEQFFEKVYYELRNLGVTPQERALNFAATDALRVASVFQDILVDPRFHGFELDSVQVFRSPVCRPDSDCYDVEMKFFNPLNNLASSRVFRVTVDVSDVMPVGIGDTSSWSVRQ